MPKRITKPTFYAVRAEIQKGTALNTVADLHGLSYESVRVIRQAKTWPAFERRKAAVRAKNVEVAATNVTKALKKIDVTHIEFQVPIPVKNELAEKELQEHLDKQDVHIEVEEPPLYITRRLDNMDQSLLRIERAVQPRRRLFSLWGRK